MTFHEPLIFLSLGSHTCKAEGFIYLYSPLASFEGSGCVCWAFCPSGVSLPPNSVECAGTGAQKGAVIGSGHQQRLEITPRVPTKVRWEPGYGSVPCTLLPWLSLPLPFACEVPSSSWALPLIFVCQRPTHPYHHLFCGLFSLFFFLRF